ncbi:MAG: NifB/NifX family molybdenum-iron cluster-binding protein [Desulfonatronovibrionaceae bacterium]
MDSQRAGDAAYKAVITMWDQYVSPRYDFAPELLVAKIQDRRIIKTRTVIPGCASADENCRLILAEGVQVVVTGAIRRRYFEYLIWKKIRVLDTVRGPWERALELLRLGELGPEAVLYDERGL